MILYNRKLSMCTSDYEWKADWECFNQNNLKFKPFNLKQ